MLVRPFWTVVLAWLWSRQWLALSRASRSLKAWEKFCDAALPLRPNRNDPVEQHVKHALAQEKADALAEIAGKDKARFGRSYKTYTRARDFMPRWVWAYVPYVEISALGVMVGWLAHNRPEALAAGINHAVSIAGTAFHLLTTYPGEVKEFCLYNPGLTATGTGLGLAAATIGGLLYADRRPLTA